MDKVEFEYNNKLVVFESGGVFDGVVVIRLFDKKQRTSEEWVKVLLAAGLTTAAINEALDVLGKVGGLKPIPPLGGATPTIILIPYFMLCWALTPPYDKENWMNYCPGAGGTGGGCTI